MKLDDRFMTILTALLLLIGVGAVMQSGEGGLLGGGGAYEARQDQFTLRAGRVQSLDVLINDLNPDVIDPSTLSIVQPPQCGSALVVGGAVQYSDSADCRGTVVMSYCVPTDGECDVVPVTLTILGTGQDGSQDRLAATSNADGAPIILDVIQQGAMPQAAPQIAMARPARMAMPTNSEVITPTEATAEVRRIGEEGSRAVASAGTGQSDRSIKVNTDSARTGRVAIEGTSMAAPDLGNENSGIAIASAAPDVTPQRATRPATPGGLAMASAPQAAPTSTFRRPERLPLGVTPEINTAGTSLSTPDTSAGDSGLKIATVSPDTTGVARVPKDPVQTGQQVAIAPTALTREPRTAPLPAGTDDATPSVTARLQLPTTGRATPDVTAPNANVERGAVEATPADRIATSATPENPRGQTAEASKLAAVMPDASPNAAPAPARPAEQEAIAKAPDAQVAEPTVLAAPVQREQDSGVLASLARSNTVLGATVSAAKALFGPDETDNTRFAATVTETAPRPEGVGSVQNLVGRSVIDTSNELTVTSGFTPKSVRPKVQELEVAALDSDANGFSLRTAPADPLAPLKGQSDSATNGAITPGSGNAGSTDVASLSPESGGVALNLPQPAGTLGADLCDVAFSLQNQVGAELVASLSSPCRPESRFLVEHAGIAFTAETDADGVANFVVPAMETNAVVRVSFPDGGNAVELVTVESLNRMTRVAVVWADDIDLDLHAREFTAAVGSDGDIWEGNPRNYRLARRSGGGYLTSLGPESGPGVRAEVYTIFESLRTDRGVIEFQLGLADNSKTCDQPPVVRVVRSAEAQVERNRDIAMDMSACIGAVISGVGIGLQEIRIADGQ